MAGRGAQYLGSDAIVKLQGMGSCDKALALDGARTLHAFLSLTVALWAGWSIPRLGSMSRPMDVKKEIAPPTRKQQTLFLSS